MGASDFSKLPHIGESLRRKEDYRFLTGAGQYTDDVQMANMTHAYFVRSPHAHAHIKSIDIKAALAAPGVIGIFDGKDVAGDSINGLPCGWLINRYQRPTDERTRSPHLGPRQGALCRRPRRHGGG